MPVEGIAVGGIAVLVKLAEVTWPWNSNPIFPIYDHKTPSSWWCTTDIRKLRDVPVFSISPWSCFSKFNFVFSFFERGQNGDDTPINIMNTRRQSHCRICWSTCCIMHNHLQPQKHSQIVPFSDFGQLHLKTSRCILIQSRRTNGITNKRQ